MARELVQREAEGRGRRVAAREEDREDLVAQDGPVAREARDGVQEGVVTVGLGLGGELLRGEAEGALDVVVDEGVDGGQVAEVGLAAVEPGDAAGADDVGLDLRGLVEGVGEGLLVMAGRC